MSNEISLNSNKGIRRMKTLSRISACAVVALATTCTMAQEEDETTSEVASDTEVEGVAELAVAPKVATDKFFFALPKCQLLEGAAEVRKPGATAWEAIEEGKYYPLGSVYRTTTKATRLTIQLGESSFIKIEGEASFGTVAQAIGTKERVVELKAGQIDIKLPSNLPEGMLTVTAPGFSVLNPAGESRYTYEATGDGEFASVRCVTGSLALQGRHFKIKMMRAANEIHIRTSQDMLFTGLYGKSGDYVVDLDQGDAIERDFDTGKEKVVSKSLAWSLSPQTAIRIHRAISAADKPMAVTIMTFDASGDLKNRCAFFEGRPELTTGEQAAAAIKEKTEAAKKAVDAAETVTVDAEPTEGSNGEEGESASSSDEE